MNKLAKTQTDIVPRFTVDQVELIRRTVCKGGSDDELRLFLYQAERTGLDPLARQIYAVRRWDARERRESMTIQTAIDGFRLIAERTGKYRGQIGPHWCGVDGEWRDVWTAEQPPVAARVGALRSDFAEPCYGVARFSSYAQRTKEGQLTRMWANMPDVMVAKCAEALALRKAFPQELSGLYTSDEMEQAGELAATEPRRPPTPAANAIKPPEPTVAASSEPHTLGLPVDANGEDDWIAFGQLFIDAAKQATTEQEFEAWVGANTQAIEDMIEKAPKVQSRMMKAARANIRGEDKP